MTGWLTCCRERAPFEGQILRRPEMQLPHYPFRPWEGDPLRGPAPPGTTESAEGTPAALVRFAGHALVRHQ